MYLYDISSMDQVDPRTLIYDAKILYGLTGVSHGSFDRFIKSVLTEENLEPYTQAKQIYQAHVASFYVCGIPVKKFTKEEKFPEWLLKHLSESCVEATKQAVLKFRDDDVLKFYENFFYEKVAAVQNTAHHLGLRYNFAGNKNGRLSLSGKNSVYSMKRTDRHMIKSDKGYSILEFDFKSSQPRTAMLMSDDDTLKNEIYYLKDIYKLFSGEREETKLAFLAWLNKSNPENGITQFGNVAKSIISFRKNLYHKCVENNFKVINPYGRPLFFDENTPENIVFSHYLATVEADALYSTYKLVHDFLAEKSPDSNLLFPFHDAIVMEFAGDEDLIVSLKKMIETNHLSCYNKGKFYVDTKLGKDWGNMKTLENII